jgi:multidrug resistance efflux pump
MENGSVIPTPAGQRWREFRIRVLPLIIFLCVIGGIFGLWHAYVMPPTLVAQVEPKIAEVRTRDTGVLTNIYVHRFQAVRAGEVVAAVLPTDTHRYQTELQMLRSQMEVSQLEMTTLVDRERLAFNYQDLRNEYMRQAVQLQMAKAQVPHAEFDVMLSSNLLREKIVSEFDYHGFVSTLDALKAQVSQLTTNLAEMEAKLASSRALSELASTGDAAKTIGAKLSALRAEQVRLESLSTEALVLRAPIDGIVSELFHHEGENVIVGESILRISGTKGDRLVGYLRQPFYIDLKPGMNVQVRTRSGEHREAESRISGIGAQFEVITNLLFIHHNAPAELGLPLAFSIPPLLQSQLKPGELVDIIVKP